MARRTTSATEVAEPLSPEDADRPLSRREHQRLERFRKRKRSSLKRGSVVPTKLAQTSAFVPRKKGLITDSNFEQVYTVDGHSIIEVKGRQLGAQHRDVLYAIFNAPARRFEAENPNWNTQLACNALTNPRRIAVMEAQFTWREMLRHMGRSQHVNNLVTTLHLMEEIRKVQFRVYQGSKEDYEEAKSRGRLMNGRGFSDNVLSKIEWDGATLDSRVTVRYGDWVKQMFEIRHLISLNADVYYKLKSDYAKSIWPFVDSTRVRCIDETTIGELTGRDPLNETAKQRSKFREEIRQAFRDMQKAGGILEWREEKFGGGRIKQRRFYVKLERGGQAQPDLFEPASLVAGPAPQAPSIAKGRGVAGEAVGD